MRTVKIGFIGMGNVGNAILNGFLKIYGPEEMIFSAAHQDKMEAVTVRTRVPHVRSNRECAEAVKYPILAVKSQYFDAVSSKIRDVVASEQVVVSPVPGITISNIAGRLGGNARVVRATPNTPTMLGEGMTGVSYGEAPYAGEEKETIRDILSSCGRVELVEEWLMDTAGCVSGGLPAFVYMFIEALVDSGVKYGPSRRTAYAMAAQTVLGSAKVIPETGKHPGQLEDEVCFPGGTTTTDVSAPEEYGLKNVVIRAADACYEKTRCMKQDNDIKP